MVCAFERLWEGEGDFSTTHTTTTCTHAHTRTHTHIHTLPHRQYVVHDPTSQLMIVCTYMPDYGVNAQVLIALASGCLVSPNASPLASPA